METTKESWCEAEINRVAGEIALCGNKAGCVKAEAYFANALEIARKAAGEILGASSRNERCAPPLRSGSGREARDILAPVFGWFTQGFDTIDLKASKQMLDKLAR